MMRFTSLLLLLLSLNAFGQKKNTSYSDKQLPSLVIGVTIDQMRNDYIDRFWNDYSEGGFKRLVRKGSYARNMQYNYMPTYTGPGHAAIFTGTTPAHNGATGAVVLCGRRSYCVRARQGKDDVQVHGRRAATACVFAQQAAQFFALHRPASAKDPRQCHACSALPSRRSWRDVGPEGFSFSPFHMELGKKLKPIPGMSI
jgi:hypothetical protein